MCFKISYQQGDSFAMFKLAEKYNQDRTVFGEFSWLSEGGSGHEKIETLNLRKATKGLVLTADLVD